MKRKHRNNDKSENKNLERPILKNKMIWKGSLLKGHVGNKSNRETVNLKKDNSEKETYQRGQL